MCGIVLIMPKRGKLIGREGIDRAAHRGRRSSLATVDLYPGRGSGQRIDAIVLRKAINSSPSLPLGCIEICAAFMISELEPISKSPEEDNEAGELNEAKEVRGSGAATGSRR